MKGYTKYNTRGEIAGKSSGGGSSSGKQANANGSTTMKVKNPDKYVGYSGKGGAASGRDVGKGC